MSYPVRPSMSSALWAEGGEKNQQGRALAPRSRQNGAMRCLRRLLSFGLCLAASAALAEPDAFGLGNGQHGALRVQQMDTSINVATLLSEPAPAGATSLTVADPSGFAAGELVLVLQVYAEGPVPTEGSSSPLNPGATGAGRWEFARLESVAPGTLSLTAPLVSAFSGQGSQVVRVPEYTSVHVLPNASLVARPWNGRHGGVLAFLATESVINQGSIHADRAGFRGGSSTGSTEDTDCAEPHQSGSTGGAGKGEGLYSAVPDAPTHGHGALGNGGGGGNCQDGGGGGGGHGGAGGQGGYTVPTDGSRDVGGRGGAALSYSPLSRLLFGGGGGAGAGSQQGQGGSAGTAGGRGGGILYLRAQELRGRQGRVSANGQSTQSASNDGSGGGGAGGLVSLRIQGALECGTLEARGGDGGDTTDEQPRGPGGGGGGGVVLLQGETIECTPSAGPGQAGTAAGADGESYGSTPTTTTQPENQGAEVTLGEAFAAPSTPAWLLPAEGEGTGPRPRLEGTALAGSIVHVFLKGALLGSVEASAEGRFVLVPERDLELGPQQVRAVADRLGVRGAMSEPRSFNVLPPTPLALEVGCGCGASSSAGAGGLALGALLLAAARRRPRPPRQPLTRRRRAASRADSLLVSPPHLVLSSLLMWADLRRWRKEGVLTYTPRCRPFRDSLPPQGAARGPTGQEG